MGGEKRRTGLVASRGNDASNGARIEATKTMMMNTSEIIASLCLRNLRKTIDHWPSGFASAGAF
jgi:hypothetical protein